MLAKILSAAVVGLEAVPVTVEVDISSAGLPSFTIVGLPDKAVEESRERVRAALKNSGAEFPAHRTTVNLAPADLPKIGPSYDIPIAIGLLIASGQLDVPKKPLVCVGELSLDGGLRHVNGILPIILMIKQKNLADRVYVPSVDAREAAVIAGIQVIPVPSLFAFFQHLSGAKAIHAQPHTVFSSVHIPDGATTDFADVVGQEEAKRVLEIAAAGGHNVFMDGPPGAGKTMLARCLPTILPALTESEALEVTKIYSVTGNLPPGESLVKYRPFRSPHHTTSRIGLIGGGTKPAPGEISLAHRGVLFLDEFPEYPRSVLEALRQPVEDGVVSISRAAGSVRYPAKFMLVAAANPCPCGNYRSSAKPCTCVPAQISRYAKRISGPIIDRIDLHIHVAAVPTKHLVHAGRAESSQTVQSRVQEARNIQTARFRDLSIRANAEMSSKLVKQFCVIHEKAQTLLTQATVRMGLSARGYYRTLKVARTIADLAHAKNIGVEHIAEAVQYRMRDA